MQSFAFIRSLRKIQTPNNTLTLTRIHTHTPTHTRADVRVNASVGMYVKI